MSRRRMVVAFVEVETPEARIFRQATTSVSVDDMLREPRRVWVPRNTDSGFAFWCAADRPDADGRTFAVAPVYRTNEVPEDACCETCGIGIRELQAMMA